MKSVVARLSTKIVVIGLFAFASARGLDIVEFARADAFGQHEEVDVSRRWIGSGGLSSLALDAALSQTSKIIDSDILSKRIRLLIEKLSIRPLSSTDWLSLAGMRLVTAAPHAEVLGALTMSSITGPNEGAVMWQRGIFSLLQWEALAADTRERTIADLAGVIADGAFNDSQIGQARIVASSKSPATRSEIGSKLIGAAVPSTIVAQMGL